jgi:mRNA interferase RelE/StbE
MFHVKYAKSVKKDLRGIDRENRQRIRKAIASLEMFPAISNLKKLSAHPLADFRLRVGEYRVLFDVDWDETIIWVLKIGHRRDVY